MMMTSRKSFCLPSGIRGKIVLLMSCGSTLQNKNSTIIAALDHRTDKLETISYSLNACTEANRF